MTDEASKTRRLRGPEFEHRFLVGRVIDIGCGPDKVIASAEPFDLEHGDAQHVAELRPNAAYDAVCSSHCLEHMNDVPAALEQWWRLVKPGGHLILVVPEENLYEQGAWPSLFNHDHKATFRIGGLASWSPVSHDIEALVGALQGARLISCELQDAGYVYSRRRSRIGAWGRFGFLLRRKGHSLLRSLGTTGRALAEPFDVVMDFVGAPVDQTLGSALAQIQVIAQKSR